jgi:hypothetical protein
VRETARKIEKSQKIMYWGFEAKAYGVPFVPSTVAPLYLLGAIKPLKSWNCVAHDVKAIIMQPSLIVIFDNFQVIWVIGVRACIAFPRSAMM